MKAIKADNKSITTVTTTIIDKTDNSTKKGVSKKKQNIFIIKSKKACTG